MTVPPARTCAGGAGPVIKSNPPAKGRCTMITETTDRPNTPETPQPRAPEPIQRAPIGPAPPIEQLTAVTPDGCVRVLPGMRCRGYVDGAGCQGRIKEITSRGVLVEFDENEPDRDRIVLVSIDQLELEAAFPLTGVQPMSGDRLQVRVIPGMLVDAMVQGNGFTGRVLSVTREGCFLETDDGKIIGATFDDVMIPAIA
jgi:hypothetical protein